MSRVHPLLTMPVAFLAVAAAGFAVGWYPLVSTDLGHHIATGRYILESHVLPKVDPLSWTARGAVWYLYQWVADMGLAWVEAHYGWAGLVSVRALLSALLAAALLASTYLRSRSWAAACSATLVALCLLQSRLLVRPMLVGYLGLALLDACLARLEVRAGHSPRLAAHLILVVWAALHPLFLLGVLRWAQHVLVQITRGRRLRAELLTFGVALATSLVAVELVVPRGSEALLAVVAAGNDAYFAAMIVELQPYFAVYPLKTLHILLLVGWLASWSRQPASWRLRLVKQALPLALGVGALLKARLFAPFVVMVTPAVACGVVAGFRHLARWRPQAEPLGRAGMLSTAAVALFFFLLGSPMGFGALRAENLYPRGVARHLKAQPAARLYHDLQFGGFVLWDLQQPSFIDGRLEVFGSAFAHDPYRRIYSAGPAWAQHLEFLGVDTVLLAASRAARLHAGLRAHPNWWPSYADDFAVVYRHRD